MHACMLGQQKLLAHTAFPSRLLLPSSSSSSRRRLDALLESEEAPAPATLLQQIRTLVDGCFAGMLRHSSRHVRPTAAAADGSAGSSPLDSAAREPREPLSLDGMRALLLQQVPVAVADLRRQHMTAEQPEERQQLARRLLLELLLRFCICAYGAPGCAGLAWLAELAAGRLAC